MQPQDTVGDDEESRRGAERPWPGVVLVFRGNHPVTAAYPLARDGLVLGRATVHLETDERLSREHARLTREEAGWQVHDLGSRNGTFLNGGKVQLSAWAKDGAVLRMGGSVFILVDDVRALLATPEDLRRADGLVVGPRLEPHLARARRAATSGDTLLVTGESGAGKEIVAREFHAARRTNGGRLVSVNCAAIPEGLAERLLFGAKKGAYSGADADTEGHVQAADGGTLFLDELGELDAQVQAKLLRVLETREVAALGAARPRPVSIHVVAATNKDVRALVGAGKFREDLYFRLGQPEVKLPSLRERLEELPWLVAAEVTAVDPGLTVHARLIEAACLRPWPGNIRELRREARAAAGEALAAGEAVVTPRHLSPNAGMPFAAEEDTDQDVEADVGRPAKTDVEVALAEAGGNVSKAARTLGIHRTQLYRYMRTYGLKD